MRGNHIVAYETLTAKLNDIYLSIAFFIDVLRRPLRQKHLAPTIIIQDIDAGIALLLEW